MISEQTGYRQKYEELYVQHMQLKHELEQLKRMVFGSKHERFVPSTSAQQQTLDFGNQPSVEIPAQSQTQLVTYTRTKKSESDKVRGGRMLLPASLPREEVIIEPQEDLTGFKKIGEEITEELEATPLKFFVRRIVRPKYARPQGEGVAIGILPSRPIDKGIAGPGLLAQIIISKFVDHLPIYRQLEIFKRSGITLSASTVSEWTDAVCRLLSPLDELHRKLVLSQEYLQADETTIRVLDKAKKGSTHRGYHWVYHSPLTRSVVFDYREGRDRAGPEEMLKDFKGYLQTDGYEAYEAFDKKPGVIQLHCMAHARRYFDEARGNDKARAEYVLTEMQKLYTIEREAREEALTVEEIQQLRQKQAVPVLKDLKAWLLENYPRVLPHSPIGKAINYSLSRWEKLSVYTDDGRLQIDNNLVENAIRPIAVGRKNYLFAGSHEGARRAAMFYSFLETCKKHGINTFEWLRDVLQRISDHPIKQLEDLLPHKWKPVA